MWVEGVEDPSKLEARILDALSKEQIRDLAKKVRSLPDPDGNLLIMDTFGSINWRPERETVHPLLVYSEMLSEGSERAKEAAQALHDRYLVPLWRPRSGLLRVGRQPPRVERTAVRADALGFLPDTERQTLAQWQNRVTVLNQVGASCRAPGYEHRSRRPAPHRTLRARRPARSSSVASNG